MSAPTAAQVLELAAVTAAQRQARISALDAGWRRLAHVGDGNAHPPITTKPGGAR